MTQDLWYALKVRSRFERIVATNLCNKGYEVFLPTFRCKSRWSDRVKSLDLPLFPGYLFSQFDVHKRLPILTTPGVQFVVGFGKIPQPVDETEIWAIRTIVQSPAVYEPYPYLTVGDSVRIKEGSLYGLTGLVIQMKDNFRLIISVNLLRRSVSVEIDRTWIEPVGTVESKVTLRQAAGM